MAATGSTAPARLPRATYSGPVVAVPDAPRSVVGRLRRRFRPPRRLRFTRQGRWFTAMTFMVGFGAINTGNNLLYLMLGMMLGLILVSGVMSEAMLRRLDASLISIGPVFAGRATRLEYRLVNRKRIIPSFSIEVREVEHNDTKNWRLALDHDGDDGAASARKQRRRGRRRAKRAKRAEADLDPGIPRCFVHRIPAQGDVRRHGHVLLPRRGLYHYRARALVTRFPFGFFEKWRELDEGLELLAYPRIVPAPELPLRGRRPEDATPHRQAGRGLEYYGLRDYEDGQDWRRIHWKVSARRGHLVIRETEEEHTRSAVLALYHVSDGTLTGHATAERAIEVTAALARDLLARGFAIALATIDGNLRLGTGPGQLSRIMRALALVEVHAAPSPGPDLRRVAPAPMIMIAPAGQHPPGAGCDVLLHVDGSGSCEVAA